MQGLSADPSTPGRLFMASDMEGFYYSDNFGDSWKWAGNGLPTAFILLVEGRGDTFFSGHAKGLSISTDKGASWVHATPTVDKTIGILEIDPANVDNIYAGVNWRGNDGHIKHYPQSETGTKEIYYSHDGGSTWESTSWADFATGDPRVQSIQVNPMNSNEVHIATPEGLYESTNKAMSWAKIAGPAGIENEYCWGSDFTPDGKWIYALYRKDGFTKLFVKQHPVGTWKDLGTGGWDKHNMWQPQVFDGSTADKHYVLVGQRDQNPNEGLFEGSFTVADNEVSGSWSIIFQHNGTNNGLDYDIGWNYFLANCRNNVYYPSTWSTDFERGVFTQAQQSYFVGDAAKGNSSWKVVSTGFVKNQGGMNFYRSRGTASTFTYDVAKYENYVIQGQADNLALESWDNGGSWVQTRTTFNVQDGHAVHVIPHTTPIVLMDAASGYGGGNPAANSSLFYKTLDVNSPNHNWSRLAFGTAEGDKKGLPRNRIWQFRADPDDYKRIYVVTHSGLYVCDNIVELINNPSDANNYFRRIHESTLLGAAFSFKAGDSNTIYYKDNTGSFTGVRQGDGSFAWTQMKRSTGQTNNIHHGGLGSVAVDGNSYLYTYQDYTGIVRADNGSSQFNTIVLSDDDLFKYLTKPEWHDDTHKISTNAMIVVDNDLYIPYHVWDDVRWGYGVVKGEVAADGSVTWSDWTSGLHYSVTKQIKEYDGKIYLATQGAGLIARKLNGELADELPPIVSWTSPSESWYWLYQDASETSGLAWSGHGNVESSSSTGSAAEGTSSRFVQGIDQSSAPGADHFLIIEFDALDATDGTLNMSLYGIGGSLSSVNIKFIDANGGSVDKVNQVIGANNWQNFALSLSGGSFDPSSFSKIQIERWGGGVSNIYVDRIYIEGSQLVPDDSETIAVTSVTISGCPAEDLEAGETVDLDESVMPLDATKKQVTWSTSDASIATVSSSGVVAGVGNGSVTITATSVNGGKKATCELTVFGAAVIPTNVMISGCVESLTVGETASLSATVSPVEATDKSVTWSSSNMAIATVSSAGVVTAVAAGSVTISAVTSSGNKKSNCLIGVLAVANPIGNGDCSAQSSDGKPNPPCSVWAESISETSVRLHWNDNSDNEVSFDIERMIAGGTWSSDDISSSSSDASSMDILDLNAGGNYKFRIKAVNGSGSSAWVETDEVTLLGKELSFEVANNEISIYPNPAPFGAILTLDAQGYSDFTVNISNVSGQIILEKNYSDFSSKVFDSSLLPRSGFYLIRFITGGKQWIQKLVIR